MAWRDTEVSHGFVGFPIGLRSAGIPLDLVAAEMAVAPFAHESALRNSMVSLHPRLDRDPKTAELWRSAENQIVEGHPSLSLEEAVQIRDQFWFGDAQQSVPLSTHLRRMSACSLRSAGVDAIRAGSSARLDLRWLLFSIPIDLLLAGLSGDSGAPVRVEMLSPLLNRHLRDHGVAETHLHLGAAVDFSSLWANALREASTVGFSQNMLRSPGASLSEGRHLAEWLLVASVARFLMAHYVLQGGALSFDAYLDRHVGPAWVSSCGLVEWSAVRDALAGFSDGTMSLSSLEFALVQASLARALPRPPARHSGFPPFERDPIHELFPYRGTSSATPDLQFARRSLALIEGAHACATFTSLFWQIVRVRVLIYRHVVQRPLTPGLQWFVRFSRRARPLNQGMSLRDRLAVAARLDGVGRGLRSLEVRRGLPATSHEYSELIRELKRLGVEQGIEVGAVLHFKRDRGGNVLDGAPNSSWIRTKADPATAVSPGPRGFRYSEDFVTWGNQCDLLARTLWKRPRYLALIRGVDVCTDELGVPHWVLAPHLVRLREVADLAASVCGRIEGLSLQRLRVTAHAGEDYVHLMTGLRNIDLARKYLGIGRGDRIGHGLALGVDPTAWAAANARVFMTREERILDLSWEWWMYRTGRAAPEIGRGILVEAELRGQLDEMFGRGAGPAGPDEVIELSKALARPQLLNRIGYTGLAPATRLTRTEALASHYLSDHGVFHRGKQPVEVRLEPEAASLRNLQAALRDEIAHDGVTVEVNPSSNLLIGDYGDLSQHPMWALRSPRNADPESTVPICIGADNPITFASGIRWEYQHVLDSLIRAGLSSQGAHEWLDRVRADSLRARFTVPAEDVAALGRLESENPVSFVSPPGLAPITSLV